MRFLLFSLLIFSINAHAAEIKKNIRFVTVEGPPFMGPSLPEQGAAIYAIRHIFKKAGYNLELTFVPTYERAKLYALQHSDIAGFFPATVLDQTKDFHLSKTAYRAPWIFVQRKDRPIVWNKPEDIIPYKVGNVFGYEVSRMFQPIKSQMKIETASTDELNLLKLANKRVDLVFIDLGVYQYLLATSEKLKPYKNLLQINPRTIQIDQYGLAFKTNSLEQLKAFNKHLNEQEFTNLVKSYIKKYSPPNTTP